MEFLSLEADKENGNFLMFSDNEEEKVTDELDNFIDDTPIEEDVSFYWGKNPLDINDYPRFNGQVRNPSEAIYADDELNFGCEDEQLELYAIEKRDEVTFDKFEGFEKSIERFKKTLANFEGENELFNSVIYGKMFLKQEN